MSEIEQMDLALEDTKNDNKYDFSKLSQKKRRRLEILKREYLLVDKLQIARDAKKTIEYIEKNVMNFPNEFSVIKINLLSTCYKMVEHIYRANITHDIKEKYEVIICIEMINFYLHKSYILGLIKFKKYESYAKHLIKLDNMVRSWLKHEKGEQFI